MGAPKGLVFADPFRLRAAFPYWAIQELRYRVAREGALRTARGIGTSMTTLEGIVAGDPVAPHTASRLLAAIATEKLSP